VIQALAAALAGLVARLNRLAVAVRIDAGEATIVAALTARLVHLALVGVPLPIAAGLSPGIALGIARLALLAAPILRIEGPGILRGLSWIALLCHELSPDVPPNGGAGEVTPTGDGPFR
jgi:hypothetical protein